MELVKELGIEGRLEEVRRIGMGSREKGSMMVARMESKNMKTEVLGNKEKLKGKDVWVDEDLT